MWKKSILKQFNIRQQQNKTKREKMNGYKVEEITQMPCTTINYKIISIASL